MRYRVIVNLIHPDCFTGGLETHVVKADDERDAVLKAGAYFGYVYPLSELRFHSARALDSYTEPAVGSE